MGTCMARPQPRKQQFTPIQQRPNPQYQPTEKDKAEHTHYTEEENLTKVGGMPSKKSSPPSSDQRPLNSKRDSECTQVIEGFNHNLGARHRPPPLRISKLGPEQVRIQQAHSKAMTFSKQLVSETIPMDQPAGQVSEKQSSISKISSLVKFDSQAPQKENQQVPQEIRAINGSFKGSAVRLDNFQPMHVVKRVSLIENPNLVDNLMLTENIKRVVKSDIRLHNSAPSPLYFNQIPREAVIRS